MATALRWQVDGFHYAKYEREIRSQQREAFYRKYLKPDVLWPTSKEDDPEVTGMRQAAASAS